MTTFNKLEIERNFLNLIKGIYENSTAYNILSWPKSSFGFFRNILWKSPNELFGQPNT